MEITSEILRNVYGEGDVMAVYQTVKSGNDFLGFARRYMYDKDYRVARIALWSLTKASDEELSQLRVIYDELIDLAMTTENSAVRRLSLNLVERLKMNEDEIRTDFLDFCMEHMVDIEEFPGTQTLCMKLAYRMCRFYPELLGEFMRTIEAMQIEYYKAAVKGLRTKILSGKMQ